MRATCLCASKVPSKRMRSIDFLFERESLVLFRLCEDGRQCLLRMIGLFRLCVRFFVRPDPNDFSWGACPVNKKKNTKRCRFHRAPDDAFSLVFERYF